MASSHAILKLDAVAPAQPPGFSRPCFLLRGVKRAARMKIAGDRLELFDDSGTRVAVFAARVQKFQPDWKGPPGSS
ncbi:MAG TPA: hypothetical protein VFO14_22765 [Vicinamibacterales bacterium]|nr:hypothetical protein [Vicinamibacterales bacterium]